MEIISYDRRVYESAMSWIIYFYFTKKLKRESGFISQNIWQHHLFEWPESCILCLSNTLFL